MPKAISLIIEDQTFKKIGWKHQYGSFSCLREIISTVASMPESEMRLSVNTKSSFLLLSDQLIYNEWLSENFEQFSISIKVTRSETESKIEVISESKSEMKFKHLPFSIKKTNPKKYKNLKINNFLEFSINNYSPYHVVFKMEGYLLSVGFQRLLEGQPWSLQAGGKYYIKRGFYSSLIAFIIPPNIDVTQPHFKLLGTHADSPCLRLAPKSKILSDSFSQLAVQTYGGALWHTWFDRELTLGGRVTIRDVQDDTKLEIRLYSSDVPLCFIPSLCPHLQKVLDETPFNPEVHLVPIISGKIDDDEKENHYKFILDDISKQLNVPVEMIVDLELCVADAQESKMFGPSEEFVAGGRLDNSISVWAALDALTKITDDITVLKGNGIPLVIAFDHKDVGSGSYTGADSDFVESSLGRIIGSIGKSTSAYESLKIALANSFLVSADMGHSLNPNYPEYYKKNFNAVLNKGILLKTNDSQRYASTSISRPILKHIADKNGIEVQDFITRNDRPCGSTIGPILSKKIGVNSIDVGAPLLSMHSIREFAGTEDMTNYADLFYFFLISQLPTISDDFK